MLIKRDDLRGPEIAQLLQQHLDEMHLHSPPESVHALDLTALRHPNILFWTAWDAEQLMGCGALRLLEEKGHGEIKSMRTSDHYKRQGVAQKILTHMIKEARDIGLSRLSLETGSMAAFQPARALYEQFGFEICPPFGDYTQDPNSLCMTKYI